MGVFQRRYSVVEAPSILGLKPTGVDRLAVSLVENGLVAGLKARHGGRVEPPSYSAERDPETLTLNAHAIAEWSPQLANAVEDVLDRRECPLILGGDCSILLGVNAGVQTPRPFRTAVHRWARRLLPAGGESQWRGRIDGSCLRDRIRSRSPDKHRTARSVGSSAGHRGDGFAGCRGAAKVRKPASAGGYAGARFVDHPRDGRRACNASGSQTSGWLRA
jgi:hypothetical protein